MTKLLNKYSCLMLGMTLLCGQSFAADVAQDVKTAKVSCILLKAIV